MKKFLLAPDSFKDSISAQEICDIAQELHKEFPQIALSTAPLSDGGEGALESIFPIVYFKWITNETVDPIGRPISSSYGLKNNQAFIELSRSTGIEFLSDGERDPLKTSTYGTGLQIAHAITQGAREIHLFIGSSSTCDAGLGILAGLGFQLLDKNGSVLYGRGSDLGALDRIVSPDSLHNQEIRFHIICDVQNPLYGPQGAAYVYGPQKGASPDMCQLLDRGLRHVEQVLTSYNDHINYNQSGMGAAGGVSAGILSQFNGELIPGFDHIAGLLSLEDIIQASDIIIIGEGHLDGQSTQGKVISGIAKFALKHNKEVIAICGKNSTSRVTQSELGISEVYEVLSHARDVQDAMTNTAAYIQKILRQIFSMH